MAERKRTSPKKIKPRARFGFLTGFILMLAILFGLNVLVQLVRKPAEFISMVSWSKAKTPEQTWLEYNGLFDHHSTKTMRPTFLAALAQTESSGNPLATPQWAFRITDRLFQIFSPASTSVGLYQFTDGTFQEAKKYCVQNGKVKSKSCLMNWSYWRTSASDSIELASAYLTVAVNSYAKKFGKLSEKRKRRLAAVIHLCGLKKGKRYIKNGYSLSRLRNCGRHNVANYVHKIEYYERRFKKISISNVAEIKAY